MLKTHDYSTQFILILSVFLAVFRFSCLSFCYIPYLDDYIQYFYYPSFEDPWQTVLLGGTKVLFTRPLAGLLDRFFWSLFSNNLGTALIIISCLYGASGILFYKTFENLSLTLSPLFLVVYLLFPLNTEGTYWISASSRIVVSLALTALSGYFLTKNRTMPFVLFSFLSVWFYEQTALLSVSFGIMLCILLNKPKKIIFPILNILALSAFYLVLGKYSDNADRLSPILDISGFYTHFKNLSAQIYEFLFPLSFKLIKNGFYRGINFIIQTHLAWWLILLIVLASLFFETSKSIKYTNSSKKLMIGILLTFIPFTPFFVSSNGTLNFRNFLPCLLGIALISDELLSRMLRSLAPALGATLIFIFSVVAACEVADYHRTALADLSIATKISKALPKDAESFTCQINSPDYYPQSAPKGDHIISMTASDWGPTGIVRLLSGNKKVKITVYKNLHTE